MDSRKVPPGDFVTVRSSSPMARDSSSSSSSSSSAAGGHTSTLPRGGRALVPISTRSYDVSGWDFKFLQFNHVYGCRNACDEDFDKSVRSVVRMKGPKTFKEVEGIVGGFLVARGCNEQCGIANGEAFGLLRRYDSAGSSSFAPSASTVSVWQASSGVVPETQLEAGARATSVGDGSVSRVYGMPAERLGVFAGRETARPTSGRWKGVQDGGVVGNWSAWWGGRRVKGTGADELLSGLSSGERKLYAGYRDDDSRDGDFELPVKRGAVRPKVGPTRILGGTPPRGNNAPVPIAPASYGQSIECRPPAVPKRRFDDDDRVNFEGVRVGSSPPSEVVEWSTSPACHFEPRERMPVEGGRKMLAVSEVADTLSEVSCPPPVESVVGGDSRMELGGGRSSEVDGLGDSKWAAPSGVEVTLPSTRVSDGMGKDVWVPSTPVDMSSPPPSLVDGGLLECLEEMASGKNVPAQGGGHGESAFDGCRGGVVGVVERLMALVDEHEERIDRLEAEIRDLRLMCAVRPPPPPPPVNKEEVATVVEAPKARRVKAAVPTGPKAERVAPVLPREPVRKEKATVAPMGQGVGKESAPAIPTGPAALAGGAWTEVVRRKAPVDKAKVSAPLPPPQNVRKAVPSSSPRDDGRARHLTMRFKDRKKVALPAGVTCEAIRSRINSFLANRPKVRGSTPYVREARLRGEIGCIFLTLSAHRAEEVVELLPACHAVLMREFGLPDFSFERDQPKTKILVTGVPLSDTGRGSVWSVEGWTGDAAYDGLRVDLEKANPGVVVSGRPNLLGSVFAMKQRKATSCSIRFIVDRNATVDEALRKGVIFLRGGLRPVRAWEEHKPATVCGKCLSIGHSPITCGFKARCRWCRNGHLTREHQCGVVNCSGKIGEACEHDRRLCLLCERSDHFTGWEGCPAVRNFGKERGFPGKSPLVADDTSRVGVADHSINREGRKKGGLRATQPATVEVAKKETENASKAKELASKRKKKAARSAGKAAKGKAVAEYEAKELTPMEVTPSPKYVKRGVPDEVRNKKGESSAMGGGDLESMGFFLGLTTTGLSGAAESPI